MKKLLLFACAVFMTLEGASQPKPGVPQQDRVRLAEAFQKGEKLGEKLWKGWSEAPFAVLLVTPENEFLIRHPKPSDDFAPVGFDSLLNSMVYTRKRVYPPNLLASFPAVSGVSTIVIGQAENTNVKTPTHWVISVLHEHFHQLQASQPSYYAEVNELNLARGNQSGSWMLEYPFPYDSVEVDANYRRLSNMLCTTLLSVGTDSLDQKVARYLEARKAFARSLREDDFKYFSFQLWQEGIARYTEFHMARLAAEEHTPGDQFRAVAELYPYRAHADSVYQRVVNSLTRGFLADERRVAFYAFGAAEGFLLDAFNPAWRTRYFEQMFFLDRYFDR
jgi:hypothetical protein